MLIKAVVGYETKIIFFCPKFLSDEIIKLFFSTVFFLNIFINLMINLLNFVKKRKSKRKSCKHASLSSISFWFCKWRGLGPMLSRGPKSQLPGKH
jgi:hypothetical protein